MSSTASNLSRRESKLKVSYVTKVDLSHRGLAEIPDHLVSKHWKRAVHLDLTGNCITSIKTLSRFDKLETLILDENQLTSNFLLMNPLDTVVNLSVNKNAITNLTVFISRVNKYFPSLQWLSMINNEASPSYFNGGTKLQYTDYRYYVVWKMPNLKFLDCDEITEKERAASALRYGQKPETSLLSDTSMPNEIPPETKTSPDIPIPPPLPPPLSFTEAENDTE